MADDIFKRIRFDQGWILIIAVNQTVPFFNGWKAPVAEIGIFEMFDFIHGLGPGQG